MSENKQNANKRMGRRDLILILILLAICLSVFGVWKIRHRASGAQAVVTVDGKVYGTYRLSESRTIPIRIHGTTANVLQISDGYAKMIEADCPDKLCVHQGKIHAKGETIVCLPNKVVVSIRGGEDSSVDAVVK
ncbi:MAG TPA: hypothetical protein DCF42_05740 [Lachnospiraceae bacterium]|nr:hypothetical protein [Lachnospiraceae bacterium]